MGYLANNLGCGGKPNARPLWFLRTRRGTMTVPTTCCRPRMCLAHPLNQTAELCQLLWKAAHILECGGGKRSATPLWTWRTRHAATRPQHRHAPEIQSAVAAAL